MRGESAPRRGRGPGEGARPLVVALAATALAVGLATAASAQDPSELSDPYATGEAQVEDARGLTGQELDTDFTPKPKQSDLFTQMAGALYPQREGDDPAAMLAGSATSFDTDLYDVAMQGPTFGFAGGSRCAVAPAKAEGESDIDFAKRATRCAQSSEAPDGERVPVVYRYVDDPNLGESWERLELPGDDRSGYIGAIAFLQDGRAMAVGGTGSYPHREANATEPDYETRIANDLAGDGRAWLYESGSWREITEKLPQEARGFTALDFYPGPEEIELGFAGALAQIVEWRDGEFTEIYDKDTDAGLPVEERRMVNGARFQFRVREIRFVLGKEEPEAYAVTTGCCAEDPLRNAPSVLQYAGICGWNPLEAIGGERCGGVGKWSAHALKTGAVSNSTQSDVWDQDGRPLRSRQTLAEGLYSFVAAPRLGGSEPGTRRPVAFLATPAGPEGTTELPSTFAYDEQACEGAGVFALTTARLVSADGDSGGADNLRVASGKRGACPLGSNAESSPDGVPDWSVGEHRASAIEGIGARALALGTHLPPGLTLATTGGGAASVGGGAVDEIGVVVNEDPLLAGQQPEYTTEPTPDKLISGWQPTSPERLNAYLASRYFALPTYSLASIDMAGETGEGFAVGAHGAIVKISETKLFGSGSAAEPEPPKLGARRKGDLSESSPYDDARPEPASEIGQVPPLSTQPTEQLAEPHLVSAGAPAPTPVDNEQVEDVSDIVLSRDGTEGWAVGAGSRSGQGAATTLFHLQDGSWTRCDMEGTRRELPPDPACAGVAGLLQTEIQGSTKQSVRLYDAARVPLERDSDPSNDDEFEVVAVGTHYRERPNDPQLPAILRYRDGRWRHEDVEARTAIDNSDPGIPLRYVAFTAPDDGWAVTGGEPTSGAGGLGADLAGRWLYHFDGERWHRCQSAAASGCGSGLPNANATWMGLTTAGDRAYLFGWRFTTGAGTLLSTNQPVIVHRDRGADAWQAEGGGLDPASGVEGSAGAEFGKLYSLAVTQRPDGAYEGWAAGTFAGAQVNLPFASGRQVLPDGALLRLEDERWRRATVEEEGSARDYMLASEPAFSTSPHLQATGPGGEVLFGQLNSGRLFGFDPEHERFEFATSDRPPSGAQPDGIVQAAAPDGRGGFWVAVRNADPSAWSSPSSYTYFLHYTDEPPRPVFVEVPHPLEEQTEITALTGAADGSVWLSTNSNLLARYDRLTGWETLRIPGWDPGQIVTRTSKVHAIAVNASGVGIAVGERGRIADISPESAILDRAAGSVCDVIPGDPPCGTSRELYAAAVAPDGSAIAAGESLALLWRTSGGEFSSIAKPKAALTATITGASMPTSDVAYLTTDSGLLFRGDLTGNVWRWRQENLRADGKSLGRDAIDNALSLRDVEVDASGHGYAVGDRGVILERTGEGDRAWSRVDHPFRDDLTSVALAAGEGEGALIGGYHGLVLTRTGEGFEVARPADYALPGIRTTADPPGGRPWERLTGPVVGLALMPGAQNGQAEAFAALGKATGRVGGRLLHYASDPQEPLLDASGRTAPLPDSPAPAEGEISFAAFGKSECRLPIRYLTRCSEMMGTNGDFEVIARRTVEEIAERSVQPGGPAFAVFTGDAVDTAHLPSAGAVEGLNTGGGASGGRSLLDGGPLKLRRWREAIAMRLAERGVPLFGAIGSQDLSEVFACTLDECVTSREHAKAGDNLAWRAAMEPAAEPWGTGDAFETDELSFEPLGDLGSSLRHEDQTLDADGDGPFSELEVNAGGASTHYAVDVVRDGEAAARLIFLDNSLRSLATSDPIQQPLESGAGGQLGWLEAMLCYEGQTTDTGERCTREPDQRAIVVANTPTYSYGPGALTDTASDFATFERSLFRYDADVVVSGRLGWNARYWATAPGIHCPGPGGEYAPDSDAPAKGSVGCGELSGEDDPTQVLSDPLAGADRISGGAIGDLSGLIPFVVASSAGGKFGPKGNDDGSTAEGYWRGYSIVRLHPSGDPQKTIVEQRPVYDWVSLTAPSHVVEPRERFALRGTARGPIAYSTAGEFGNDVMTADLDEIDSPAITHRYELLLADPEQPWLACEASDADCVALHSKLSSNLSSRAQASRSDAVAEGSQSASTAASALAGENPCDPYLCLPERIGTVDRWSGDVQAGNGRHPDTFAIAQLSVADHVATYPLMFKKSPSFIVQPLTLTPQIPPPPTSTAGAPPPPPPPPPPMPNVPHVSTPALPGVPPIAPLQAAQPPEPQPPAPPAPPPPTEQPSPLSLTLAPPGITVATPTAVIQPPTPPVNPAPPGGARREARQRQAAAQKSGADNEQSEGSREGSDNDLAQAPPGSHAEMRRRDRVKPGPSITALARPEQPSAWAQGALYTGGIALMAFALAAGFSRPTPRRRPPEVAAPAYSQARIRSRR